MCRNTDRKKEGPNIIWFISVVIFDISALAFMLIPFATGTKTNQIAFINLIIYVFSSFYGIGKLLSEAIKDKKTKNKIKYLLISLVLWSAPIILYIVINYILTAM